MVAAPDSKSGVHYERMGSNPITPTAWEAELHLRKDMFNYSDIPFEMDKLRYGGHERESNDEYWLSLCEEFGLNYVYITDENFIMRDARSRFAAMDLFDKSASKLF